MNFKCSGQGLIHTNEYLGISVDVIQFKAVDRTYFDINHDVEHNHIDKVLKR